MAENLNIHPSQSSHRDYGAMSSSSNISNIPNVNFSGFSPTEFMSLVQNIGHNITTVHSSWKQLEKMLKVIGTARDQQQIRDKVQDIQTKTNARIKSTSEDLQRLTAFDFRSDKQQKLQLEKLTNDFRAVVEKYSQVQKQLATAMKRAFIQSQDVLMQEEQTESDRKTLIEQQKQIQADLQFEQAMLVDRERQIKQIEANILDVNAIMRTIGEIIQAQSGQVDSVETNIENATTEVELGRSELEKAAESRRSYRRKILILLGIAVIIGLIVTGIVVDKFIS